MGILFEVSLAPVDISRYRRRNQRKEESECPDKPGFHLRVQSSVLLPSPIERVSGNGYSQEQDPYREVKKYPPAFVPLWPYMGRVSEGLRFILLFF